MVVFEEGLTIALRCVYDEQDYSLQVKNGMEECQVFVRRNLHKNSGKYLLLGSVIDQRALVNVTTHIISQPFLYVIVVLILHDDFPFLFGECLSLPLQANDVKT